MALILLFIKSVIFNCRVRSTTLRINHSTWFKPFYFLIWFTNDSTMYIILYSMVHDSSSRNLPSYSKGKVKTYWLIMGYKFYFLSDSSGVLYLGATWARHTPRNWRYSSVIITPNTIRSPISEINHFHFFCNVFYWYEQFRDVIISPLILLYMSAHNWLQSLHSQPYI